MKKNIFSGGLALLVLVAQQATFSRIGALLASLSTLPHRSLCGLASRVFSPLAPMARGFFCAREAAMFAPSLSLALPLQVQAAPSAPGLALQRGVDGSLVEGLGFHQDKRKAGGVPVAGLCLSTAYA